MKELTQKQAEYRVSKLKDLINDYRYEYHVNDRSIMDDAAADSLKHELAQLEERFPELITPDSPTQRVAGAASTKFASIEHRERMLSLNDVFDETELVSWEERIAKLLPKDTKLTYFTDLKMDGFACALVYIDGLLTQAVTRGDGYVGEDVTSNVRTLESVPLRLRASKQHTNFLKGRTEIRGEIVMYKDDFEKLNVQRKKAGQPLFANPRNTAAGTIRQLDPKLVAARPLHFHAYDLIRDNPEEVATHDFAYKALASLGLISNKQAKTFDSLKQVLAYANDWQDERKKLAFNTDGLVVKVNDRKIYAELGVVGKAPRAAVAFKYPAEQSTTKVKDIFVSIGRTGAATPVAVLEPVVVAGSTVQMATLHNQSEVAKKDIRIGDTVIIHKAGDIIPEVIEPLVKLRTGQEKVFHMPTNCPECNTKLVKQESEAVWRCPNEHCPSRSWKRIEHYASKAALDIEGLGEKNVIALIEANLISDTADIYQLKKEDLEKLDRFAEISSQKLVEAIADKKRPTLARFLYGLGIRHVGSQTAIDLANKFKSMEALSSATVDELGEVDGVGEVVAEAIAEWFSEKTNQTLLAKFHKLGVAPQKVAHTGNKLSGQNFVITGTLSVDREEMAEKIRELGGTFQSSVGNDTTYVVVGDNPGSSKLAKAEKLGTKIIDEAKLVDILKG